MAKAFQANKSFRNPGIEVLTSHQTPEESGQECDFFLFSELFHDAAGYQPTQNRTVG
jgi:hypothetical protein